MILQLGSVLFWGNESKNLSVGVDKMMEYVHQKKTEHGESVKHYHLYSHLHNTELVQNMQMIEVTDCKLKDALTGYGNLNAETDYMRLAVVNDYKMLVEETECMKVSDGNLYMRLVVETECT